MLACNPVGPALAGRAVFLTNKCGVCTDVLPAKAGPTGLLEPVRIYSRRLHFKPCRCMGCTGLFANEFAPTTLRKSRDHSGTCGSEACPR